MTLINPQFVVVATGGGSLAIGDLLSVGGASSYFLEGLVPYSKKSLDLFLGFEPDKYCTWGTARKIAMQAFRRALELDAPIDSAVGISCTASLAKPSGEREGRKHEAHIGIQTKDSTRVWSLEFLEKRSREEEEIILASWLLEVIKMFRDNSNGLNVNVIPEGFSSREWAAVKYNKAFDTIGLDKILFNNKRNYILVDSEEPFLGVDSVIFPGSFNPIHEGHANIIKSAHKTLGKKVYLEISVTNPDKPPSDFIDVNYRIDQIRKFDDEEFKQALAGIIISNTPLFFDKIWQYPTSTYLAGTDTVNRLFDKKYGNVQSLIDLIKDTNTKFLVANRKGYEINVPIDYKFSHWYIENRFKFLDVEPSDISSSAIRKGVELGYSEDFARPDKVYKDDTVYVRSYLGDSV